MTYEQFWEGDPYLTLIYRDLDTRRKVETNWNAWLIGRYVYEAIDSVIHNRFSRKGSKAVWYPDEPHRITPLSDEETKQKAEAERQKAIKSLSAWKEAWDKQHGRQ